MRTIVAILVLASVQVSQATVISWDYTATISAGATDFLGIDGERIDLRLELDSNATWLALPPMFSTVAADVTSVSITGSNTIAAKTNPAAFVAFPTGEVVLSEGTTTGSFFDFVINGTTTVTSGELPAPSPIAPKTGDILLLDHLPRDPGFRIITDGFPTAYRFVDATVRIETGPVSESSSRSLLAVGLLALGLSSIRGARR